MSRLHNAVLLVIWLVVATHIYGLVWSRYPDYFPEYPESVGRFIDWLTRDYQPRGIESLTTYYYLILSFPPVAVLTALGLFLRRKLRRRAKPH